MTVSIDTQGWTTFAHSNGIGVTYYCSFTDGNDANDGRSSVPNPSGSGTSGVGEKPAGPVKSSSKANSLMTKGNADWFLLRQNDTWVNQGIGGVAGFYGSSATEISVIGSYDPSQPGVVNPKIPGNSRPSVHVGDLINGLSLTGGGGGLNSGQYCAVVGIDFYAYTRDPGNVAFTGANSSSVGINTNNGFSDFWFLIEDCSIRFFADAIEIQPGFISTTANLTIRRCVVTDSYHGNTNSSGIFIGNVSGTAESIIIEDNIIDGNGFNFSIPASVGAGMNIQNHNLYIHGECSSAIIRNNIISNSASDNQTRSGGSISNNLFVKCTEACNPGLNNSYIENNVITQAVDILKTPLITSGGTSPGSAILNFTTIPTTPSGNVPQVGDYVGDLDNPTSIPKNTKVLTGGIGTNTITITSNVVSPGVSSGDRIVFSTLPRGEGVGPSFLSGTSLGTVIKNNIFYNENSIASFGSAIVIGGGVPCTVTQASPAVVTTTGSNILFNGTVIIFNASATGGLIPGQKYYVVNESDDGSGVHGSTFNVATTLNGVGIATTAASSPLINPTLITATGNIVYGWDSAVDNLATDGLGNTLTPNIINLPGTNGNAAADGSGIVYKDATRTVGGYGALWGCDGTLTGFLAQARLQSKSNWRPQFTATAVNNWIRDGFSVTNYSSIGCI